MTARFFALLTNIGAAKLANATTLGTRLEITQMAVGDGGGTLPTPNPAQTKLVNEQRRAALNMLTIDPINTSQIIAEQVIPETEGGWWIREIGLLDKDGDLVAIANCAETYKPQLQEGSGRTQTIRMILIVSSTAAVTLKIDPSVVLATRKYADDKAIEVKQYADNLLTEHEKSRNHPDASKTEKGFVKLSSATTSDSEVLAATPKAVKTVAEAAAKALGDHGKDANPHDQYFQIANLLSEIKALGPAALAETLANLGLGDISTRLPKFIILYPDGTESAPAIMTKNIRKAIANPFPGRRVEALVEVLIAGQWGATGWLYNPNVAGFGSGISAYPYGSNSSDDFIIIQSGGLEVTTSSSSAGNPHGISAQVTSAPYRIRIKTVN
ncbi:phage tail-collar fiber domain-containing protein [Yersinia enterocolitica]|uniref:Tail fiber protein n=2 Tax=root TaxID=1 RepID=A0AAE9FQ76_9CAUD|nr:phage tail protein [Yersinia enterocolitica]YP_010664245.1 tail fiber protein [Yersinia phage vB_YenM_201.16]MCE3126739.1 phage tail protein [Yersinia enterocolitica]UNA05980.1 tail fiber protein [Yersinia phage vB_YenM_201.16]CQH63016.1 tail fiber protein [Yersinia enterocolitica]